MADKTTLDTGYAHYADIVFAAGFAETSGNFLELVTDTLIGVESGVVRGSDATYGETASLTLDSTDEINFGDNAAWDGFTDGCTLLVLARNNKGSIGATGTEWIAGKSGSGADSLDWYWLNNENTVGLIGVGGSNTTDTIVDGLRSGVSADEPTDWNLLGFTWDDTDIIVRINTTQGSGASVTGTQNATAHDLYIGDRATTSSCWDGDIAMAVIMDVALSETDWDSLVTDPLQVFASGATAGPRGPFGHPLHGCFAGPIT